MQDTVERFRDVDASLRTVVTLGKTSWESAFMREDVRNAYTNDELDTAYRTLMANQTSSSDFNQVIEFGELEGQFYVFEEIIAVQFPISRYESLYASYDRTEPFPFFAVIEAGQAVLADE